MGHFWMNNPEMLCNTHKKTAIEKNPHILYNQ